MSDTTDRLRLPFPEGSDGPDGPDVPYWMQRLAVQLDNVVLGYDQGVIGSRPAAGVEGRLYWSTDEAGLSYDTGAAWVELTGSSELIYVGRGGGPTFNAAWSAGNPPVRFWRERTGRPDGGWRVYLTGQAAGSTGAVDLFVLPRGFRPAAVCSFPQRDGAAAPWVQISPDGSVTMPGPRSLASAYFDGISFDTGR